MDGGIFEGPDGREALREIVAALEAIVVALQAERTDGEPGYAMREAVRRVVALRQRLGERSGRGG
ncbi:MAG: hypothetical protein KatS3mg063_1748 [Tepidiforma sp.]|jgi:hypothetical protein|uniref:Uncharacterized protein n=1 Tax=Tepidiforma bonchosmolovskayae TaxID=2601677 RepID=A0ABX6BYI4_9CHLR|nr:MULTISPECIES: hypothetical protein [Tepidiforma]QFG02030.1 hypothetical protein Tbon_01490 [Tepidiforma bonchosmolovskayae]GIW15895.1 MAG: hypothetical protein KatS3mg063_1748 [Tepidiforma sp.]